MPEGGACAVVQIGYTNQCLVIHNLFSDRTYVRRIVQISDLSTLDGKVLSYHGCDG